MAKRRPSGDDMVRKREEGRWEGWFVVGRDERGFPVTKNVLARTKAECAEKLRQLRERLAGPLVPGVQESKPSAQRPDVL